MPEPTAGSGQPDMSPDQRRAAVRAMAQEWEWNNPRCPICDRQHPPDACTTTSNDSTTSDYPTVQTPASGGTPAPVCDECGHSHRTHGEASGCGACPCPFYRSDLLPMTPEQVEEVRRARR